MNKQEYEFLSEFERHFKAVNDTGSWSPFISSKKQDRIVEILKKESKGEFPDNKDLHSNCQRCLVNILLQLYPYYSKYKNKIKKND